MGRKPGKSLVTPAEARILEILWEHPDQSVREIWEKHFEASGVAYTTVLKTLQNMHEKSLVVREDDSRSHRYRASAPEEETKRKFATDFLTRVFGGSPSEFLRHAIDPTEVTQEDIKALETVLTELKKTHAADPPDNPR